MSKKNKQNRQAVNNLVQKSIAIQNGDEVSDNAAYPNPPASAIQEMLALPQSETAPVVAVMPDPELITDELASQAYASMMPEDLIVELVRIYNIAQTEKWEIGNYALSLERELDAAVNDLAAETLTRESAQDAIKSLKEKQGKDIAALEDLLKKTQTSADEELKAREKRIDGLNKRVKLVAGLNKTALVALALCATYGVVATGVAVMLFYLLTK